MYPLFNRNETWQEFYYTSLILEGRGGGVLMFQCTACRNYFQVRPFFSQIRLDNQIGKFKLQIKIGSENLQHFLAYTYTYF